MNLVVGQITNLGDFHKFCKSLIFEGRNNEKCTEVTINMHFENTKVKIWKKKHAYSFPIIATNGLHIGPNLSKLCHPLAREGDKKNRCQQHHLVFWFFSTWFGVKLFLYPKKLLLWVWVFKMLNSMHVVFYFFPCCPQLPILPKSPQRHQ